MNFLRSIKFGIILLTTIILVSIVGTVIPQNAQEVEYIRYYGEGAYTLLRALSLTDIFHSWLFVALLLLLVINIILCSIEKISSKKKFGLGFFLTHLSLILILLGGFIGGICGKKGYLNLFTSEAVSSFKIGDLDFPLGFSVTLEKFELEKYANKAQDEIGVYKFNKLITVLPVQIGREYSLSDGTKVRIEQFIPDFTMDMKTHEVLSRSDSPNNPALRIKVIDSKGNAEEQWLFANFPNFKMKPSDTCPICQFVYKRAEGKIKNFKSLVKFAKSGLEQKVEIKVNHPFKFQKFTFYQTNYDKDNLNYSGLQVVYDPGVPLVYLGFIALMFGLTMVLFENRKMGQRREG